MENDNKQNLHFFEAATMRELYNAMHIWQEANLKRFLSVSIQQDREEFCCIALTNPSEVVITDANGTNHASVTSGGRLCTS